MVPHGIHRPSYAWLPYIDHTSPFYPYLTIIQWKAYYEAALPIAFFLKGRCIPGICHPSLLQFWLKPRWYDSAIGYRDEQVKCSVLAQGCIFPNRSDDMHRLDSHRLPLSGTAHSSFLLFFPWIQILFSYFHQTRLKMNLIVRIHTFSTVFFYSFMNTLRSTIS